MIKKRFLGALALALCSSGQYTLTYATDSIALTPLDGQQQSTAYVYANGEEQLPIKVTIHYDTRPSDQDNDDLFNNLVFSIPAVGLTSKKINEMDITKRCTDNPFVRMHVDTDADQNGERLLNTTDRTSNDFWKNETNAKWETQNGVDFCFTSTKNIFSTGVYGHLNTMGNLKTIPNGLMGVQCTSGDNNCTASRIYYMQIEADHEFGADKIQAKTHNDTETLDSGNANENIFIDKFSGSPAISVEKITQDDPYKYKLSASVQGTVATILYAGADVNVHDSSGGDTYGTMLGWYSSMYQDAGKYLHNNALVPCGGDAICIHNAYLDSVNDTVYHSSKAVHSVHQRIYLDNSDFSSISDDECDQRWAGIIWMDYNLTSKSGDDGKPQGSQATYMCTSREPYKPRLFRFYILDQYGNFFNISQNIENN